MKSTNDRFRARRQLSKRAYRRAIAESLEGRQMLSISPASLTGPINDQGTTWTYTITNAADGETSSYNQTVVGPATFNGMAVTEVDTNFPSGAYLKVYYGFDSTGDYVLYGSMNHTTFGDSTSVEQPYTVIYPATMDAGVPYVRTYTQVDTDATSGVVTTTPYTTTLTLLSETPSAITVPAGTYDGYQVREDDSAGKGTSSDGTTSDPSTSTSTVYAVPYVGIIKSTGTDASEVLTAFNDKTDHLAFDQPPTTTAAGTPIDPAVTVSARDTANNIDTSATGSITLTLASASRLGTSPGTLSGTATEPLVNGVATFSDLTVSADGTYQLTATDSDTSVTALPSGKFKIGTSDLKVEITNKLVSKTKGGSLAKGAQPGDTILYSVLVTPTPTQTIDTANVVLTLPSGFVPAGITSGGVFAGNTITWTTNTRLYDFDVTVPSPTVLAGLKQVATSVDDNVTYTDGSTDEATTTNAVKLIGSDEHLKIMKQPPGSVDTNAPFSLSVALVDAHGKRLTDENTAGVQLSFTAITGGSGAVLGGTTTATFAQGLATFPADSGPMLNSIGKYTITVTETGVTNSAGAVTPATTAPFRVRGDQLRLASHVGSPFVAGRPEFLDDNPGGAGVTQVFQLLDPRGRPVTSVDGIGSATITGEPVAGAGVLVYSPGTNPATAGTYYHSTTYDNELAQSGPPDPAIGLGYTFNFTFSSPGLYKVTVSPTDGAVASFEPFSYRVRVDNPAVRTEVKTKGVGGAVTNEPVDIRAALSKREDEPFEYPDNNIGGKSSVGFQLSIASGPSGGTFTGPAALADGILITTQTQNGQPSEYGYNGADFAPAFNRPGKYVLKVSEVMSPDGQNFDPNTAVPVTTTDPDTITLRVLPDRLEVAEQPPLRMAAGQPFEVSVALTDSDGNTLTDQSSTNEAPLLAVLTSSSTHGTNPLSTTEPVEFVNGIATFTGLVILTPGVYRLTITVQSFTDPVTGVGNPAPTVKTTAFRVG